MNRDELIERLKMRLDLWNAEINRIENTAQVTQAEAQEEFRKQIEQLCARRDAASSQLEELRQAGGEAWKDLQTGVEEALAALGEAVDRARARFTH
jgi:hypothetical protein